MRPTAVREATGSGVLRAEGGWLAFRHEIARQCIETELPTDRRAALHAQVLDVLREGVVLAGLAREVHHAIGANRHDDVAALAPRAAEEAAGLGSHREAAALYRRALAARSSVDMEVHAYLLEAAAGELQKTGELQDAIDLRQQALALRRAAGDRQREGINLRLLGVLHRQWSGDKAEYLRFARAAVECSSRSVRAANSPKRTQVCRMCTACCPTMTRRLIGRRVPCSWHEQAPTRPRWRWL